MKANVLPQTRSKAKYEMGSTAAEAMARSFSDKVRLASRTDAEKEVENLPQDMRFSVSQSTARVKFYDAKHPDRQSPDHPVLGALPSAWELRAKMNALEPDKCDRLFYYNTCTRETSMEDPRGQSPDGPSRRSSRVVAFRDSALQRRLSTGQSKIRRRHIGSSPELEQLRSEQVYAVVKTLDPGSRQGKGGMNGGVHVVRCLKGPSGRLYVRKDIDAAGEFAERCMRREIRLMRDLKHCGLVAYIDAAVEDGDRRDRDDPWLLGPRNRDTYAKRSGLGLKATVIMEYCDLGTLDDLLHRLSLLRENGRNGAGDRCPEAFVWHAWMALVDALAFLQTGLSVKAGSLDSSQASRKGGWKPLIHGDIKPDNVFLRLSQSSPYPHVLLADWGLARSQECAEEEDRTTFQGMDFWFLSGSFLYHAVCKTFPSFVQSPTCIVPALLQHWPLVS